MRKIKNIDLHSVSNGLHLMFMTQVLQQINASKSLNKHLKTDLEEFKAAVDEEQEAMRVSRKSLITDSINKAEKRRGELYSIFRVTVRTWLKHPMENVRSSAKKLNQLLKNYGISLKMQRDRKSGLLMHMLAKLKNIYKDDIVALSLETVVEELQKQNELLISLMDSRNQERAGKVAGRVRKARVETERIYRELVEKINALFVIESSETLELLIKWFNVKIKSVGTRKKRKRAKKIPKNQSEQNEDEFNEKEIELQVDALPSSPL